MQKEIDVPPDPNRPARTPEDRPVQSTPGDVQRRTLVVLVVMQIIGTVGVGVAPSIGVLLAG